MKSRPSIRDVAAHAKVSVMTVSRILGGKAKHSAATTQKVMAAAEALGYRPNGFAKQLRSRDRIIVGVIFTRLPQNFATLDLFESKILGALEAELITNGTPVLLSSVSPEEIEEGTMPDIVIHGFVDTIVCLFIENPTYIAALGEKVKNLIHIGRTDAPVTQIEADNREGARIAARHLHGLGHRKLVLVRPHEHVSDHVERVEVFCAEFISLCGGEGNIRFAECSVWNNDLTEAAVSQILAQQLPDAIFCTNDFMALQIMRGLKARGIKIPQDVSLMGFDDMELAEYSEPPLSTIAVDKLAIGSKAAELALACLRNGKPPSPGALVLPVQLVERASAARKA
ncbi:MAG: LacI family transcriptional regulator [Verrucomicrobia bacterium]|nr:LacI family transcriptional regulator [Verrucomicrobiota bacterium]